MSKRFLVNTLLLWCTLLLTSGIHAAPLSVGQFLAISIPLPHPELGVKNVWEDISIVSEFTAPSGHLFNRAVGDTIGGFYHSKNLWMVRFTPDEVGIWHYKITLNDRGTAVIFQDSFVCVPSAEQGFIRLESLYSKRWIYSGTGNLFSGIGFGDCMDAARDSILEYGLLDGGYRTRGVNGTNAWALPYAQYLIAYGDVAGFNLYRYSDGNCAYSIIKSIVASGNNYDTLHSRWTDTLFYALREHGFRIYMTMLLNPVGSSSDPQSMAAVKRYAQYCIDRFGPLVDFWELTNESSPDSLWTSEVARYIGQHDPYHHLISVSWEQPNHPAINIISPHWYGREDVRNSDQITADKINKYSSIKKPVIFGEQGEGTLWDSLSGTRMRGRMWSSLFNGGSLIFWNTSFAKDCPCNQYLGWEERRYVRVFNNFCKTLLPMTLVQTQPSTIGSCKVWGMLSLDYDQMACYIRNDQDINAINTNISVDLRNVAKGGEAIWYDVHTGDILQRTPITAPLGVTTAPPFKTDIALIAGVLQDSLMADTLFRLNVNPRTISLLNVPVKSTVTESIGIKNTGTTPITIQRAVMTNGASGNFTATPSFPLTMAPADSETIVLNYSPSDTGIQLSMLSLIRTGSPAWENIAITASAIQKAGVTLDQSKSKFELTPDPANAYLVVHSSQNSTMAIRYEIYSVAGQKLLEGETKPEQPIDIRILPNGSYQAIFQPKDANSTVRKFTVVR